MLKLLNNKRNIYDYIIILVITSVIFAGEMFRAYTPIIIIGLVTSVYFFVNVKIWTKYLYPRLKYTLLFFFFLCLYSIASLIWISDIKQYSISTIWLYCFIFDFLLIFYSSLRAKQPIQSILIGWMVFIIFNLSCSFWEILTGEHLSAGSYTAEINKFKVHAAVTYGNYNSLSIVLCLSLLFNLLYMYSSNKLRNKLFSILLIVCIFIVLLINTSRGSLLCFALFFIPLWYSIKNIKSLKYTIIIIIGTIIIYAWYEFYDIIYLIIENQINSRSSAENDPRWRLWSAGLNIATKWWFIGSGPGSMVYEYTKEHVFILFAHNLWIQILLEYGFIILSFFVGFYLRLLKQTLFTTDKLLKIIGLYLLFCWPVLTIIDEAYLKSFHWTFFASIISIIYHRKNNNYEQNTILPS